MRTDRIILWVACLLFVGRAHAQFIVTDPINIATSIANTTRQIVETSSTARHMSLNFRETVKIYEQGKRYYDALRSVNGLVKDDRKVQKTILMVGEVSEIYVKNFQKMVRDPHYTVVELRTIASGYTKLLDESNAVLRELRNVVNHTTLSMTDKERMDLIDRCYHSARRYRTLVGYYTNKNIGVSLVRSRKVGDTERVIALYGSANDRYW